MTILQTVAAMVGAVLIGSLLAAGLNDVADRVALAGTQEVRR